MKWASVHILTGTSTLLVGSQLHFILGMKMYKTIRSVSKQFVVYQLAEGVFAAIAEFGGSADSNSGIIDLGGQVVIFDTFLTPQTAMNLRLIAEDITGWTPKIVVNSHYHNDHIWGNQSFIPDAQIVSSTRTRELIATAGMEEFQWYSANSVERLEALRSLYQNSTDELERMELSIFIGEYDGLVEALPRLVVCKPNITFSDRLEIHGSKQTAELITFEGAHTESDTVLYLPREGIIFMSDLLFVGCHPYLADGDPRQLLKALNELSQFDAVCFVPGHGSVGTIADVRMLIEYVDYCIETAQVLTQDGNPFEDRIVKLKIPEMYTHWQVPKFFRANIRYLCQRVISANGD